MAFSDFEKRQLFEMGVLGRCSDKEGNINWDAVDEDLHSECHE